MGATRDDMERKITRLFFGPEIFPEIGERAISATKVPTYSHGNIQKLRDEFYPGICNKLPLR